MQRNVSTKDIAEILGIARSTVIRALNNDPKIKDETIQKVHTLAKRLGYQKNSIARSLASGRTDIIGCVMPNLIDPFFGEMVTFINAYLYEQGRNMLLGVSNDEDAIEEKHVRAFLNYRVDGVLLNTSRSGFFKPHIVRLHESGIPLVIVGSGESIGVDSVMADDELGAFELISHLADNGYERIALLGDLGYDILSLRIQGYKRALLEHNLRYDVDYIVDCGKLYQVGQAVEELLSLPEPPDAIFACNDFTAIETIHAITKLGKNVPEDIAVVGFDNISFAKELRRPLTTVDLRSEEVARRSIDLLLEKIADRQNKNRKNRQPQHVRIQPRLCIRETSLEKSVRQLV